MLYVKFLFEAGVVIKPVFLSDIKLGNLLKCATYNTKDPIFFKYLLTYGAQVDKIKVDSNTAFIHVFQTNNIRFAILLLDYYANLNSININ